MTDLAALARRVEELEKQQAETVEERDQYKALYQEMLQRCAKLERGIVSQPKSERVAGGETVMSEAMLELLFGDRPPSEDYEEETAPQKVKEHERHKPTGRKKLPDHLARVEVELIPEVVRREGLDAFERIGEVLPSMSRKGDCWDNAVAESFFATLKNELVHGCAFQTRTEAYDAIADYIENFYNTWRRHSHNGYVSPNTAEHRSLALAA